MSVYKKIDKVRKPRVQISYDIEDGGQSVKKEIPFVVGVLGDFSGNPEEPLKPFKQRKFVEINGDNFNKVMEKTSPELNFKVKNTLKDDDSEIAVKLKFNSIEDFQPDKVAEQVEPLKKLLETREQLKEVLGKADVSEDLESLLEKVLKDNESLQSLSKDLGIEGDESAKEEGKDTKEEPKS